MAHAMQAFERKRRLDRALDPEVPMAKHRIAWLPGDGIGGEVLDAARVVLDRVGFDAEYVPGDIGWEFWQREGDAFPPRTIELLRRVDAAMFGAITSKPGKLAEAELLPELRGRGLVYRSPIVRMRQMFDLYVCLRPCRAFPRNPLNYRENIDLVVFRENTEDLYAGVEFLPLPAELRDTLAWVAPAFRSFAELPAGDVAVSCKINTRHGSERIVRAAFEHARRHQRRKVTVVHKANVVRASDGLFLETARDVARHYPDIEMDDANVDAMTMWLLKDPQRYDVLVAPNLYGDILSDLCAQMVGGLGFGCSGNIGEKLAVFEPTHGSAPKHAGRNEANPIAAILAAKMMLEWLGETEAARRIETAVADVVRHGRVRTYDMGGADTTRAMGEAIAEALEVHAAVHAGEGR
jgi:3-isopropylmalate dehydrogenase